WECAMDLLAEGILEYTMNGREPERNGNRDPHMAPHGNFKCIDWPEKIMDMTVDRWVSIVCADDAEWGRLANAMGQPELANDPRFQTLAARKQNEDQLEALVQKWTSARTVEDVIATLQPANVAVGAVADNRYLSTDANLTARNFWVYKEHPEVGKRQHAGIPWRMSGTPTEVRAAAPTLGQHTDEVLTSILGYSADEVASLRNLGALD
ncbi:MAG TPA: CoA transferase, partial [Candidatus Binataceae bacterium]|nr:CoA transferase [Candidatus Binataceae bacterium]